MQSETIGEPPVYVNAKQYHRIIKRRVVRQDFILSALQAICTSPDIATPAVVLEDPPEPSCPSPNKSLSRLLKPFGMRKVRVKTQAELPRLLTFFKSKAESKRPESAAEERISRLNRFDRCQKLLKHDSDSWLRKRGKSLYMGFSPVQKQQAKAFFDSLDTEGAGGVTIDELLEPLLALGLVHSRNDVKHLFHRSDSPSDSVISFEEFLSILEREKVTDSALNKMIKALIEPSPLPHQLRISSHRRKLMLDAYIGSNAKRRENGLEYLRLFAAERHSFRANVAKKDVLVQKKLQRLNSLRQVSPNVSLVRLSTSSTARKSPDKHSVHTNRPEKQSNLSGFL